MMPGSLRAEGPVPQAAKRSHTWCASYTAADSATRCTAQASLTRSKPTMECRPPVGEDKTLAAVMADHFDYVPLESDVKQPGLLDRPALD